MIAFKAILRLRQTSVIALILAFSGGAPAAQAAEPFYLGTWKIVNAEVAPWAKSGPVPDPAESKKLIGKAITLEAKAIRGPGSFPCEGPQYEVIEGPAEMLFQGMFGAMKEKDSKVDPQALAEQAGFSGTTFRTVLTGCEFAVDFSFGSDPDFGAFALDNYIYTLTRQ